MKNTNLAIIVGNLTTDVELKKTAEGLSYVQFSLAVKHEQKNSETNNYETKTEFVNNLALFGHRAEALSQFMKKGTKLLVQGYLKPNTYEKNGNQIYTLELKIEEVEFLRFSKPVKKEDVTPAVDVGTVPNITEWTDPIDEEVINSWGIN